MGMGIGTGFQTRDSGPDSEFTTEWWDTESTTFPSLDNCHQTVTVVSSSVMPLMTTWAAEETQKATVFLEDREIWGYRIYLMLLSKRSPTPSQYGAWHKDGSCMSHFTWWMLRLMVTPSQSKHLADLIRILFPLFQWLRNGTNYNEASM